MFNALKGATIFFLFAAMFVLPMYLCGQPMRVTNYTLNDTISKTIIRKHSYPATVSYVECPTKHLFVYNDGNMSGSNILILVPIDINYYVNDFVIHGDSVFFCGTTNGEAFFGAFEVNDFFNTSLGYWVTNQQILTTTSYVATLNRIVTYAGENGLKRTAIGKTATGLDCIVELSMADATTWHCRTGELTSGIDKLLDISLTNDYVVTAGIGIPWGYLPSIRVYDKSDIFSSSGIQDTVIFFWGINKFSGCCYDSNQVALSVMQGNSPANYCMLATHYKPTQYAQTMDSGFFVGLFVISPIAYVSPVATNVKGIWTSHQNSDWGWRIRGMTSLPSAGYDYTFHLLQDTDIVAVPQPISMVLNLDFNAVTSPSSTMTVPSCLNTEYQFQSIDWFTGDTTFV